MNKVLLSYVPHAVDPNTWIKVTDPERLKKIAEMKASLFGADRTIEFVVMYNSRNIRRKSTSDVILAFNEFRKNLPAEKQDNVGLLLHTQPVDPNGTDLMAVIRDVCPDITFAFTPERVTTEALVDIYNIADVIINMSSNEGFGIGTLEAIMSERMIICNVTGGLQDQLGFKDEQGNYLDPDIHFNEEWGTNAEPKYLTHGEWAVPVFPNNRSLIGSPATPYIFDDRCDYKDAAKAIRQIYDLGPEERARRGKLGREYAMTPEVGMYSDEMSKRIIHSIETSLDRWQPRKRFGVYKP